ncbi:hypothetical protein P3X46_017876 [Hevea brasiliensis]|uniref:S-protein homolog n=1 Tax=Hevea brasiliensis TaxID=3981 RepID=A0ABQ9LP08_HEVBR|nr:S-protein homolog 74-like [Hevea brasiliensis]KAJ9169717.1 hypothetical protein P3X46_017876 [Hevea brasiliensis]
MSSSSLLFILALALFITSSECSLFDPYHVHVTNILSQNKILLVHCKSKDDDLGVHNLTVGQEFSWSFKLNFFGTTLFWCYMAPDDHSHVAFKVFWVSGKLFDRCDAAQNCFWVAKDDGVYLRDTRRNEDVYKQEWQPGRFKADHNQGDLDTND